MTRAQGTRQQAGWLQSPFVFGLLCGLGALPLVFATMPPLTDLGGHLGRYAVQLDGGASATLRQWYSFHWALIPNLGADLLMQMLAPMLGLEPALKLIVIAIPVLQIAGWLLLARAVHGHVPPTALFALPLAYGYPFQFGFLNFTLCAALATCFLALWVTLADRGALALRWAVFAPLACVLWITHLAGYAVFCVLAGADEAWRFAAGERTAAKEHELGRAALRAMASLSCLLAPWLVKLAWPAASSGNGAPKVLFAELWKVRKKLAYLVMPLRDRWAVWDIASALVILAVLGWCWSRCGKSQRFSRHGGLAFGAACLALIFMVLPGRVMGSAYADMRLLPTVLAIGLIAIGPGAGSDRRAVQGWALAGLVFVAVRLAGNGASMALLDRQFSADFAVLKAVPPKSQLVSLVVEPCDPTYAPWNRERRIHLGGYAIARYDDFSNDQWMMPGGQLLQIRNPAAGEFASDPSETAHAGVCHGTPGVVQVAQRVPAAIAYLWILADGERRSIPGWHPIGLSAGSVVYSRN